jgi:hypothetical protein
VSKDERTKDELQKELRRRDLPVSGTKQELLDRLEEDDSSSDSDDEDASEDEDAADEDAADEDIADEDTAPQQASRRPKPMLLARRAALQLRQLTGRTVEGVAGLRRVDDEWVITLEVLEVSRVPNSTDILGSFEVTVDADGELLGYERIRRFVRGQASEE